jgi:GGDEF domain-containing protein
MLLSLDERAGQAESGRLYDRISDLLIQLKRTGRHFAVHLISVQPDGKTDDSVTAAIEDIVLMRLRGLIRSMDTASVIGHEFLVIQTELYDPSGSPAMLTRLIEHLREPIDIAGRTYTLTMQIGTSIATRQTSSVNDLLTEADVARSQWRETGAISITGVTGPEKQ